MCAEDVIRLNTSDGHGGPEVAERLYALARNGATGAVHIVGNAGGTVYLDGGHLTFAESPEAPDLPARLVGSGRLTAAQWARLAGDRSSGGPGVLLVEQGLIGGDELAAVLRSAVLDALTALTVTPAGRPVTGDVRFAPLERHWARSLLVLEIESVRAEVARRAGLLAGHPVSRRARPRTADLRRPWGTFSSAQWPVLCRIDGVTTVRDLAWRNGLALYDTIESVHRLAQAGFCTLPPPEPADDRPAPEPARVPEQSDGRPVPRPAGAPAPEPARASEQGGGRAVAEPREAAAARPLPRRRRGAPDGVSPAPGPPRPPGPPDAGEPVFSPARPDVLNRLLEGLKRMG